MIIAGVDEVGRGPLAGPVITAAVILPKDYELPGLTDSKKLSAKRREVLYEAIKAQAVCIALGNASRAEIDQLNILQATMLGMQRAVNDLKLRPELVLVDGNRTPSLDMPSRAIIGGDGIEDCISAASIIAKVYRDRLMTKYAVEYPQYGWDTNSGYGTKQHLAALQEYGVTLHHRRTFAPVARLL
jgi:ribonuclease HII